MTEEFKTYLEEFTNEASQELKALEEQKYKTPDQDSPQMLELKENLRE